MSKTPTFVGRKKSRRYALQALYGWALSGNELAEIEAHTLSEHLEDQYDIPYFQELLHEVPKSTTELENIFSPFLSRGLEDVSPIELTILRIATYELKARIDIPYRVVINEALELAKTFGAADSHKFVNGVLDKVARQIRTSEF